MSACKGMTQYNDGCRAFLAFAVSNCTATDSKSYYPCKSCRNNQRHPPEYVLAHVTEGRGMSPRYILWYMHGKTRISGPVPGRYSNHVAANATARSTEHGGGTEQGGSKEQGGDMLVDLFLAGIRIMWPQMRRLEAQNMVEAQNRVEAKNRVATC